MPDELPSPTPPPSLPSAAAPSTPPSSAAPPPRRRWLRGLLSEVLLPTAVLVGLLAIAVAVFVSSRGPVIYRSIRPGIGGEPFRCFKFRTMRSGADQMQGGLGVEPQEVVPGQTESTDGCLRFYTAVWPMPVVSV